MDFEDLYKLKIGECEEFINKIDFSDIDEELVICSDFIKFLLRYHDKLEWKDIKNHDFYKQLNKKY